MSLHLESVCFVDDAFEERMVLLGEVRVMLAAVLVIIVVYI